VFVPGPVEVHAAFASQPPLLVLHELTAAHTVPVPEYPVAQVHDLVPGPVEVHAAWESQPPLPVAQALIAAQVLPSPA
jgi:hypothetical protein